MTPSHPADREYDRTGVLAYECDACGTYDPSTRDRRGETFQCDTCTCPRCEGNVGQHNEDCRYAACSDCGRPGGTKVEGVCQECRLCAYCGAASRMEGAPYCSDACRRGMKADAECDDMEAA